MLEDIHYIIYAQSIKMTWLVDILYFLAYKIIHEIHTTFLEVKINSFSKIAITIHIHIHIYIFIYINQRHNSLMKLSTLMNISFKTSHYPISLLFMAKAIYVVFVVVI